MNRGRLLNTTAEQITDLATSVMPKQAEAGTVLLSFKLSIGKVGIAARPLYTNEAIASLPIRRSELLTPEFLYWALRSADLGINANRAAMGATLNKQSLVKLPLPLPPLEDQRRIADILNRADALRAKRREALVLLDDLAQSIFVDMFGEPTRNERGWKLVTVGDFVSHFGSGKSLVADDAGDADAPYRVLKVSAVSSGRFRPDENKALPRYYSPPSAHLVSDGDLLFSRANTAELIGAAAMVTDSPGNLALSDKLWRFAWPTEALADPTWVWFLFNRPLFRREVSKRATGTSASMKNISQDKVMSISVGLPPLTLQTRFAMKFGQVRVAMKNAQLAVGATEVLFSSLQQRAFAGEL